MLNLLACEADENVFEYRCPSCETPFETFAVHISSGVLGEAVFYLNGDCERSFARKPSELAIVELASEGPRPRDEWLDPPFSDSSRGV
jgi:hypothetical protein